MITLFHLKNLWFAKAIILLDTCLGLESCSVSSSNGGRKPPGVQINTRIPINHPPLTDASHWIQVVSTRTLSPTPNVVTLKMRARDPILTR